MKILLLAFNKTIVQGVAGGGEQIFNRGVVSSLAMSANPVTMEAVSESKVLWCILLMIRSPLNPQSY